MTKRAVFTIVSCTYFHYAKTLMQSVRVVDTTSDLYVVIVDGAYDPAFYTSKIFHVINFLNMPIPDRNKMCFQYDILELNTAVKPFVFKHLFTNGYEKVIYLDPDIYVFHSLEKTFNLLEVHDAVVTPHLTEPLKDKRKPCDLDILRSGVYNLGFLAVKSTNEVQKFIEWWGNKLVDHCRVAIADGIFVDQKWCDFLPSFVEKVLVDHNPGMNVAYWNLKHRQITHEDGSCKIGDCPLIFFHFSGLDVNGFSLLSRHEDRFESSGLPNVVKDLKKNYLEKLHENGARFYSSQPYHFGHFADSNISIPKAVRDLYRQNKDIRSVFGSDPFDISCDPGFVKTYNRKVYGKNFPVTLLCESIYNSRSDLQAHFPKPSSNGGCELCHWFVNNARIEYDLDDIFIFKIREDLKNAMAPKTCLNDLLNLMKSRALMIIAAQFTKQRHRAMDHNEISKIRRYSRIFLEMISGNAKAFVKRILGLERCHEIRESVNKRLLQSFNIVKHQQKVAPKQKGIGTNGLNVIGYLKAESGVGESVRSTIRSANAVGIPVSAINFSLGCHSRMQDGHAHSNDRSSNYAVNLAHVNADQTPALIRGMGPGFFSDRYNIGYWVWETTEFPCEFLKSFECYDEIWTASEFCRDALSRKSPKAVLKVPHSISLKAQRTISRPSLGLPENSFLFLTMADFLSVPERKNPLGVIDSFFKAFGRNQDDVRLVIKISNSCYRPDARQAILDRMQGRKAIILIDGYMDRPSLNSLIARTDCYVSLHRSEGFGLPIAEAMSLGKPAIATGWSGNMDFMDK
ncbi:MAG: glycosyltransferase family 4 protein, partial [Pseudomonadota bacterium]